MRFATLFTALCVAAVASADQRTAQVYIQSVHASTSKPAPLAEISYDMAALDSSSIVSYEAPEIPEAAELVRIGLYDPKSAKWLSGTTVAAANNFGKGFAPTLMLSVDVRGDVVSASCRGVKIDAGQTRDFGPKAVVVPETPGKQPELNKPVVLSPTGQKVAEEPEKTFLQKYVLSCCGAGVGDDANLRQVLVDDWDSVGGDDRRRRRRREIDIRIEPVKHIKRLTVRSLVTTGFCLLSNYGRWSRGGVWSPKVLGQGAYGLAMKPLFRH